MTIAGKERGYSICKNCGFELTFPTEGRVPNHQNRVVDACPNCGATQWDWKAAVDKLTAAAFRCIPYLTSARRYLFDGTDCGGKIAALRKAFGKGLWLVGEKPGEADSEPATPVET